MDNYLDGFDLDKYKALSKYINTEFGVNLKGIFKVAYDLKDHAALEAKIRSEVKAGNIRKKALKEFLNS